MVADFDAKVQWLPLELVVELHNGITDGRWHLLGSL